MKKRIATSSIKYIRICTGALISLRDTLVIDLILFIDNFVALEAFVEKIEAINPKCTVACKLTSVAILSFDLRMFPCLLSAILNKFWTMFFLVENLLFCYVQARMFNPKWVHVDYCVSEWCSPPKYNLFAWIKRVPNKFQWCLCRLSSSYYTHFCVKLNKFAWTKCWPGMKVHVFEEWVCGL